MISVNAAEVTYPDSGQLPIVLACGALPLVSESGLSPRSHSFIFRFPANEGGLGFTHPFTDILHRQLQIDCLIANVICSCVNLFRIMVLNPFC
jgi:hypothetical protein